MPDFATAPHLSFGTAEEVTEHSEGLWCRNGGPLAPTMFPPRDPQALDGTECMSIGMVGDDENPTQTIKS